MVSSIPSKMAISIHTSLGISIPMGKNSRGTKVEDRRTPDRVETAAALVEHRLPPTQQVGGTRRRVIVIVEGIIKQTTHQQSN